MNNHKNKEKHIKEGFKEDVYDPSLTVDGLIYLDCLLSKTSKT